MIMTGGMGSFTGSRGSFLVSDFTRFCVMKTNLVCLGNYVQLNS